MTAEFGSLANPIDVQNAVDAIVSGGYVSVQYHGVFIMVFSGVNLMARHEALRVKNEEDTGKPLSSISFSSHIFPSVDLELIQQPATKGLLSDISQFQKTLGTICHVRLPLKESAVDAEIPSNMVSLKNSVPYVQNLDPYGNLLFANFSRELNIAGVQLIAATSLNLQGESEICDLSEAKRFCRQRSIPYLLHDPLYVRPEVRGSFPVIDLESGKAIRDGHVPIQLVEKIIGTDLDKTDMQPSKHPHAQHFLDLCDQPQLAGIQLRESILNYLYGK
jgi:hypothetical protein